MIRLLESVTTLALALTGGVIDGLGASKRTLDVAFGVLNQQSLRCPDVPGVYGLGNHFYCTKREELEDLFKFEGDLLESFGAGFYPNNLARMLISREELP